MELLLTYFSATEERVWPTLSIIMEGSLENSVCSCLKCRRNSSIAEGKHAGQDCSQQHRCYGTPSSGCSQNAWSLVPCPLYLGDQGMQKHLYVKWLFNSDPEALLERLGRGGGTVDGNLKQLKLFHASLVPELPCIMLKPGKFGNKNTAVQLNKLLRH